MTGLPDRRRGWSPAAMMIFAWSLALFADPAAAGQVPDGPTGPIETKYFAVGPYQVAQVTTTGPCDAEGNVCDIWYPANIRAHAGRLPVVLWGNGSDDKPTLPSKYGYILSHFASWGFVVVATRNSYTGYGSPLLEALASIKHDTADPGNVLHDKLDFTRVAAVGHSQGADGAVNAMLKSNGAIITSIAFELPSERFCNPPGDCVDAELFKNATQGSIFLVTGSHDGIVAPDTQRDSGGLNSATAFYDAFPARLTKAKGVLVGPSHNDVTGKPDCKSTDIVPCLCGVYGYLGFPTAWLVWRLRGDRDGHRAFGRDRGEIFSANAWQNVLTNVP
jgi:hypothetical protein